MVVSPRTSPLGARFIWTLALLVQVLRILGWVIIFVFPDFRCIVDFNGLLYANDGRWYVQMAMGEWFVGADYTRLANFSTFFPLLIYIFGWVFTPILAPYVINTLCTIFIPFLAAQVAMKLIPLTGEAPTEDQLWRQKLVVLGISLNPLFLGYSIFALTEPLYYMFFLILIICNQNNGPRFVVGELITLFIMGWTKFNTLIICALYAYQLITRDFMTKNYKHMLRPIACIILALVNFVFWNIVFPRSIWGLTASEAMALWWGVKIAFPPDSIYFVPKILIEVLAVVGILSVARTFFIRKGYSYMGFRDRYLAELRKTNHTPAADGLLPNNYPEFNESGKIGPFNYELIEALFFYTFCILAFQALMDPLESFIRYVATMIPLFGCISFQNRATDNTPGLGLFAIIGAFGALIGAFAFLLYSAAIQYIPEGFLPPGIGLNWWPEMILNVCLLVVVIVLFFKYYYSIKNNAPKAPDFKRVTVYLSICSVILMFSALYMP